MKRGTPRHPKMLDLGEALGIPSYAAGGLMEFLWHFVAEFCPRGDVGRYDNNSICKACGWKGNPEKLINALVSTRWLDEDAKHRLIVHNWHKHADDSVRKKLARMGEDFLNGSTGKPEPSIYFLYAEAINRVKIGFTEGNLKARIDSLQVGSPEKLVHIGSIPGSRYAESQMHRRWKTFRVSGEWFEIRDELKVFLEDTFEFGSRKNPKKSAQEDFGSLPLPCLALPLPSPAIATPPPGAKRTLAIVPAEFDDSPDPQVQIKALVLELAGDHAPLAGVGRIDAAESHASRKFFEDSEANPTVTIMTWEAGVRRNHAAQCEIWTETKQREGKAFATSLATWFESNQYRVSPKITKRGKSQTREPTAEELHELNEFNLRDLSPAQRAKHDAELAAMREAEG